MLFNYLFILLLSIATQRIALFEKNLQIVKAGTPALLKTTNGCWDVSHIVINRGDTTSGINGSVGYFAYAPSTSNDSIIIADYLPQPIIDASFPDISFQEYLGNNDERYFTVTTQKFIYLYYTLSTGYLSTTIVRFDSLPTPPGCVKAVYNGKNQLLVVSKADSFNFDYAFYSVPDFKSSGDLLLNVKPDIVQLLGSIWYVIIGDSAGTQKMLELNQDNQQVNYNITLPEACKKTRAFQSTISYYYFISSPGDSTTNLIQFNTRDNVFNVINLYPHSGLNDVIAYSEFPTTFLLQPSTDSVLNKKLLMVDAVLGTATDTISINKTINSLHKNSSYGFGQFVYSIIMGCSDSTLTNFAFFFPPWGLINLDSAYTNSNPSWFGEDYRCYSSTEQVEENLSIDIYPNPATDKVLILVNHLASGKMYKFDIIDLQGKVVWSKDILTRQKYMVPLQSFPDGILILRVNTGSKVVTKKFIKQQ